MTSASKERTAVTVMFGDPDGAPDLVVKGVLSSRRPSLVSGVGWTFCLRKAEGIYSQHRATSFMSHDRQRWCFVNWRIPAMGEGEPGLLLLVSLFVRCRIIKLHFRFSSRKGTGQIKVPFCVSRAPLN